MSESQDILVLDREDAEYLLDSEVIEELDHKGLLGEVIASAAKGLRKYYDTNYSDVARDFLNEAVEKVLAKHK